ncbi:FtsK/SpoIIIE domain-containing protein [Alicyclobacillus fastidiosus]|uniref:FtsK/SpoIIIE domain-containing protein n=1 Tax=Alicyclobacillus fastidiosus TaxID=392011 RepID=A0ABV5AKX5_9BACL|nr:FtsK/SpoIIIE domain-containing protein [Alicyclobacillus fastidiosus]WEH09125.1 FtsK/SpoIIIE domain-containing protein [Alicyclobacillus fastidiosus]
MTPEQQEAEQRFNEQWDNVMRAFYLALYFMFRHIKHRWKVALSTLVVWSLCYAMIRYLPTLSWHIPAGVVLAALLVNIFISMRAEQGQVHVHPYAVEDALKACGLWDSTHYRRPRLLAHKTLPGGDIQLTFDASVPEDTWPAVESRFCGSFGIRKFRRVFRNSKNQINLVLASGQLRRPTTDVAKLVAYARQHHVVPMGEGFNGIETWDYITSPSLLICGMTGSGKSSLLRVILSLLVVQGCQIILVDGKAGVDYQPLLPYLAEPVAQDVEGSLPLFEGAWAEHSRRLTLLLETGFSSLAEAHGHGQLLDVADLFVVVDEYLIFSSGAKEKAMKEAGAKCLSIVEKLAVAGRASGVHLILSTQYGTTDVLGSQVKQQLFRVTGRLEDELASKTILSLPGAEAIPPTEKGHFVYRNGEELQHFFAYHVDDLHDILSYASRKDENVASTNG